ncbi:MAG: FkbM family methyltransferase [Flavobacteriales bacterium]|nr:FkbM family methyltransferase [Flavobacteriales bacterium]
MKRTFSKFIKERKYDALIKKIMRIVLEEDSSFIDVGCYRGNFLIEANKFAPSGAHIGFEPIPEIYTKVIKTLGGVNDIRQLGLSDERGETTFNYVKSNPLYSGIKKRNYPGKESIEELVIKVDTLDHQLFQSPRVDLIKIDVEGAELNVLKGGINTITKFNPVIVFEYEQGASDVYGVTPAEIWSFFDKVKYSIYTLKNFIDNPLPLSFSKFTEIYNSNDEHFFVARFRSS